MDIKIRKQRAIAAEQRVAKKSSARSFAQMTLVGCLCIAGSAIPALASGWQGAGLGQASLQEISRGENYTIRPAVAGGRHSRENHSYPEFAEPHQQVLAEIGLSPSDTELAADSKLPLLQLASSRHFHHRGRYWPGGSSDYYYRRHDSGGFPGYKVQKRWMRPTNKGFSASRGYGRFYGPYQNFYGDYYRGPRRGAEYFIGGVVTQDAGMNCKYEEYCTIYLDGPKIITRNEAGNIVDGELVEPMDK